MTQSTPFNQSKRLGHHHSVLFCFDFVLGGISVAKCDPPSEFLEFHSTQLFSAPLTEIELRCFWGEISSRPDMFFEPFVYNGILYSVLFGALGTFAGLQVLMSMWGYKDRSHRYYSRKIWFHIVLALFGCCESLYAASLALHKGYSQWGLVMHTVALYVHVLLFALIINFWKLSLNDLSPSLLLGVTILGLNGIVTVVTVMYILILGVQDFQDSFFNALLIVVNSLTLLVMSFSLLVYGRHMKNNILESSFLLSEETSSHTKAITKREVNSNLKLNLKILGRINRILAVSLVCYSARVLSLGFLFVMYVTGHESVMGLTVWLAVSWFVPFFFPALVYLNIMKLSSSNANRGTKAFNFFEDDNVPESAMIDDARRSDDWDCAYEQFSDCSTHDNT